MQEPPSLNMMDSGCDWEVSSMGPERYLAPAIGIMQCSDCGCASQLSYSSVKDYAMQFFEYMGLRMNL